MKRLWVSKWATPSKLVYELTAYDWNTKEQPMDSRWAPLWMTWISKGK